MDLNTQIEKARYSKFRLWLLNRLLWRVVPFNKPHRLIITSIGENDIEIRLPYKQNNLNHIKGVHACALATLSEYITGLSLLRVLKPKDYRLIMKKINVEYFYQGKQEVIAKFGLEKVRLSEQLNNAFKNNDFFLIPCSVDVYDVNDNHICTGKVEWHIKPWNKVKTNV